MNAAVIAVLVSLIAVVISGCANQEEAFVIEPYPTPIPTPSSLEELRSYLVSEEPEERVVGMWAVVSAYQGYVSELESLIVDNLIYEDVAEVRLQSARVIGKLEIRSSRAVELLIGIAANDEYINARIEAAITLGKVGDLRAIPVLASNLYDANRKLAVVSANAISLLLDLDLPETNSPTITLDEDGQALIVLAAREWWETTGKFEVWP